MKNSLFTRILSGFLVTVMLTGGVTVYADDGTSGSANGSNTGSTGNTDPSDENFGYSFSMDQVLSFIGTDEYLDYEEEHAADPVGTHTIVIKGTDYDREKTDADVVEHGSYEGEDGVLETPDKGSTTWKFTIEDAGKYAISIKYFNVSGTNTTIERMLYIDGELPFSESRYLYFPRTWTYEYFHDEDGNRIFDHDINDNDIRPIRTEVHNWREYYLRDWVGFTMEPFQFYLEEGEHELTLTAAREPFVISEIKIYPYEGEPTYEEKLAEWKSQGIEEVTGVEQIKVQAELPDTVSIQSMFPGEERTSALTEPIDPARVRYNVMNVGSCNQFATYTVTVPKEGLYKIAVRFRQNALIGLFSSRRVLINNEIQFKEASYLRFFYDTAFQSTYLNDGEQEFLFYFKEGENTVTFETVLGEMKEYVYEIRNMVDELYDAYQSILMVTGPTPNVGTSYNLTHVCGAAVITIAKTAARLDEMVEELADITGEKGDQVNTLETVADLFDKMAHDESEIISNFVGFKNYVVMLSNWMYTALGQSCNIDRFVIMGTDDQDKPKAKADFLEGAWFEIRAFVMSFFMDYTTIAFKPSDDAEHVEYDDYLEMWAGGDREGTLITRRVIDNSFTPQYNIGVTLRVISAGLQEAILAGIGPDISSLGSDDAITWGLRTAVEPLNDFEGFDEVKANLAEAAMIPVTLYGTTYSMPTSMSFDMMFYRLDVLAELGLDIPKTWDDLFDMMSVLQNKRLEVGLPTGLAGLNIFLYQQGIDLYADDGWRTNLDSHEAISAFETFTSFFRKYSSKTSWDMTRFRTGEIPIIISDVGTYNTLMGYYELRGLWEMAPMLGTVVTDDEGNSTINYTSMASSSGLIIPRGASNPETSWKYIKWMCSTEAMQLYRNETIAVSSPTTKVTSSNIEVFLDQPWTDGEYSAIYTQLQSLASVTNYPGNYIVSVYVSNAFLDVYNDGRDASEAILDTILDINKEISRKRKEFGMDAYDISYSNSWKTQDKDQIIADNAAKKNK